ncbi:class I SAM-dependent methyltransferase [Halorussus lipolyticus]|uniref:class I SAM-dependent methyltransferase n=1 Tax=Halorussus lipolyticus TaxID=3034024 RepID=UPI0023E87601|nr:class I SAM-dependent methyltransferase [Halorussus sp. DT80]
MNFQRYLSAKRTVDDRALNQRVEARLADELRERARRPDCDDLRVLEVGAGIGATLTRFLSRPWLPDRVRYTVLDLREENVSAARERLPAWAAPRGYAVRRAGDRHAGNRFLVGRGRRRVEVEFRTGDAFDFLAETGREFDLVVAHAFVDLVDPADALAAFRGVLAPGGVIYCPITFDGGTIFESGGGGADSGPDSAFEERVVSAFHDHIDAGGDSRAGRHLLSLAPEEGAVLAVGGSDWVVRPREDGYPADEAYFLDCIVEMVGGAVEDEGLDSDRLDRWTDRRRDQIESAELVYCTHQLDLLVR